MSENRTAIYVPMPLNSSGDGPADPNETVRVEHQVWDAETNLTMFTAQDATTALAVVEAWNRRTPAPEGGVSLWGCADGNGIDPRLVFRDRPTAEQVAADTNMVVQPLYASPVVPVGAGEDSVRLTGISLNGRQGEPAGMMTVTAHMSDGTERVLIKDNGNVISHWRKIAALIADQGSRSKASVPTEGGQAAVLDWIEWNGGPNPVPGKDVDWRNREGREETCCSDELEGWGHPHESGERYDIIAYRLSAPASPIPGGYEPKANEPKETDNDHP
jgi:hypothetical protein